ncbi:DNA alkylation repair protein [Cupriavidus sp. 30B13]|uniref:DNA alkylation repair protein n=1 Tax=Cupriavidus sp. 30B13 TaxID=3384241 RepID=UPI003B8FBCC4
MTKAAPVPLKLAMGEQRLRELAKLLRSVAPDFDAKTFLAVALDGLEDLTLMARVRQASAAIHAACPSGFDGALAMLSEAAPRLGGGFMSLVPPDYVGQYGRHAFDVSMAALRYFTQFGSSEFGVREFLRDDLPRALATMEAWSTDPSDAVRRLASEGSRPRLPWSFRLGAIEADPALTAKILGNLRADGSLYVRKSVANHLNDIAKTHPQWVLDLVGKWPAGNAHTAWIVKQALRTLVKQADPRALAAIGAGAAPRVAVGGFAVTPASIALGDSVTLSFELVSTSPDPQRLVVDYRIAYVKKSGATSAKVFKLKALSLAGGQRVSVRRSQHIRDFTTRTHYPGRHEVELVVNGQRMASAFFDLRR